MLPPGGSTFSNTDWVTNSDWLFNFIWWGVSLFFFVLIVVLMGWFAYKYRRRTPDQKALSQQSHSTALELGWTVPPLVIVFFIFYLGFAGYRDMTTIPDDSYEIYVTAKKWAWEFKHPSGYASTDLEVPRNRPIKFTLYSSDVIHSFWVPAFRVKKDVVPGRFNKTWFQVTAPVGSEFYVYCTEFCGQKHADMAAKVIVKEEDFAPVNEVPTDPVERGKYWYNLKGCIACHTLDGSVVVGPSFKGLYGADQRLADGSTVKVDDAYLIESILKPDAKIAVKPDGSPYVGQMVPMGISEAQAKDIVEYMKTLK